MPLQFLAGLACALYWFHPLVWIVRRNLRRDSERACDDAVQRGGLLPSTYAALLLDLATSGRPHTGPLAAVSMARPGDFEGRLLAILDGVRDRRAPGWRFLSATAASFVLGGVLLSSVTAEQGMAEAPGMAALPVSQGELPASSAGREEVVADPSPGVRKEVARALGELDDPRTLLHLSEYARADPDRDVRKAAIRALARSRADGQVDALSGALGGSGDGWTRGLVVKALGETRSPRAVAALEPLVDQEDGKLRREATKALAELGGGEARAALVRALSNDDPEVRSRAARGLGEEGR